MMRGGKAEKEQSDKNRAESIVNNICDWQKMQ
jgi:hypothetical protein